MSLLKEFCSCRHARHTPHGNVSKSNEHGCMSEEAHLQAHRSRYGSRDVHWSHSSVNTKPLQATLYATAPTFHEHRRSFGAGGTNSSRARWTLAMTNRWPHSSRCRACGHGVGCGVRQRALEEFAPPSVGVDRTQGRPFTPILQNDTVRRASAGAPYAHHRSRPPVHTCPMRPCSLPHRA